MYGSEHRGGECMRTSFLLIVMCCFFLGTATINAADLRGRVDGMNQYASAPFPLAKAKVEIKQKNNGKSVVAFSRTGRDGMYYFRNIQPGQYFLVVNGRLTVEIQVDVTPLQDIGPLLFNFE